MLGPVQVGLAVIDLIHGDAIGYRADKVAQVAAHALLVDYGINPIACDLRRSHNTDESWLAICNKGEESAAEQEGPAHKRLRQSTIPATLDPANRKLKAANVTQAMVDASLEKLIVDAMLPFDTVSNPAFIEHHRILQPERTVMPRTTLMRRIKKRYARKKAALIKQLKQVESVATTTDLWTAHSR